MATCDRRRMVATPKRLLLVSLVLISRLCLCSKVSTRSCRRLQERISKDGVCSASSSIPCRSLCSGEIVISEKECQKTPFCCMRNGLCTLKTVEPKLKNKEKVTSVSESSYWSARDLLQAGPNSNFENLQRRSISARFMPINYTEIEYEASSSVQGRSSSFGGSSSCSIFPFSCKLPPPTVSNTYEYQQPDINIPYCQRIPCRAHNFFMDANPTMCLSTPGCAYDHSLFFYRSVYGNGVLPNVPICHLAYRNKVFIDSATEFILKYRRSSWNPIFNRCLLEEKKTEIFRNPPGCEMIILLENLGHMAKMSGWSNITERECHLIGSCWLRSRCLYPMEVSGSQGSAVSSTNDLLAMGVSVQQWGEEQCGPMRTDTHHNLVTDHHRCLSAGCALRIDNPVVKLALEVASAPMLDERLHRQFKCMVRLGKVRPDNWRSVLEQLRAASLITPEQILGSVPLVLRDGTKYAGLEFSKLKAKKVGSLPDGFRCERAAENSTEQLPPSAPTQTYSCPFTFRQLPNYPPLEGRLDGCCDTPRCFLPRQLRPLPGVARSGIASYLTAWGAWSECASSCGQGAQTRERRCVDGSGVGCIPAEMVQLRMCQADVCPRLGQWSAFGSCSRSCGTGVRVRRRACVGDACSNAMTAEKIKCNLKRCSPFEWSSWGACSKRCKKGSQQVRRRRCLGTSCKSQLEKQTRACQQKCQ